MHQDIEKLLNAAKEKGYITEKQREIIVSKAEQLGEDMAEIEFLLEDIPIKKRTTEKLKTKRCPNCGALVEDLAVKCPECGHTFSNESEATANVREIIEEFSNKLKEIKKSKKSILKELKDVYDDADEEDVDIEITKRTCELIGSFNVPLTANAIIQAYEFVYGRYEAAKAKGIDGDHEITGAWLGKAKELYLLMQSVPNKDATINNWLQVHADIIKTKNINKGLVFAVLTILGSAGFLVLMYLLVK